MQKAHNLTGCGALAVARLDNLYQVWGPLIVAGLGIGGIVVPASIMTTIICPDVSHLSISTPTSQKQPPSSPSPV